MSGTSIDCMLMRGGTSKGPFFLASDLPSDGPARDEILLAVMGSPDLRQIDGLGGANPLTSKVAIVAPATRPDADIDYLFLQVVVDRPLVDASQNCGNMLAGVGAFAIERGLYPAGDPVTEMRVHMVNSASIAVATVRTPGGVVDYEGDAQIDGVPGTAAPVLLDFQDTAGSTCGAMLPSGSVRNVIEDVPVTLIDNGMPVVIVGGASLGVTGAETPLELESNMALKERVERLRLSAGRAMRLGDVSDKTVPKVSIVTRATRGGAISTRTFIPHRIHEAIGVLGAVSVASACILPGSVAHEIADLGDSTEEAVLKIEHPTGSFAVAVSVSPETGEITRSALLRTARKIMDGKVFVPRLGAALRGVAK